MIGKGKVLRKREQKLRKNDFFFFLLFECWGKSRGKKCKEEEGRML